MRCYAEITASSYPGHNRRGPALQHVAVAKIIPAGRVSDRRARVERMAEVMREMEAAHGACTIPHLSAKGFSIAEQFALAEEARAIVEGREHVLADVLSLESPGKAEGAALVIEARKIKRRNAQRARRAAAKAKAA